MLRCSRFFNPEGVAYFFRLPHYVMSRLRRSMSGGAMFLGYNHSTPSGLKNREPLTISMTARQDAKNV